MGRLSGKIAMVVGSATGIGRATVEAMAREGARVMVADIREAAAAEAAAAIRAAGGQATHVGVDIAHEDQIAAAVQAVVRAYGGLHVLHNNAARVGGDAFADGKVTDMSAATWDATLAVNLRGPMLACKHAIPVIIASGGGSIINTGSASGLKGDVVRAAYGASKAGMLNLTLHIAATYGREGVRCNQISPGMILTRSAAAGIDPEDLRRIRETVSTPLVGEPEDIAHTAVYLASDEARYVTGQVFQIDGGYNAHAPYVRYLET